MRLYYLCQEALIEYVRKYLINLFKKIKNLRIKNVILKAIVTKIINSYIISKLTRQDKAILFV